MNNSSSGGNIVIFFKYSWNSTEFGWWFSCQKPFLSRMFYFYYMQIKIKIKQWEWIRKFNSRILKPARDFVGMAAIKPTKYISGILCHNSKNWGCSCSIWLKTVVLIHLVFQLISCLHARNSLITLFLINSSQTFLQHIFIEILVGGGSRGPIGNICPPGPAAGGSGPGWTKG